MPRECENPACKAVLKIHQRHYCSENCETAMSGDVRLPAPEWAPPDQSPDCVGKYEDLPAEPTTKKF